MLYIIKRVLTSRVHRDLYSTQLLFIDCHFLLRLSVNSIQMQFLIG